VAPKYRSAGSLSILEGTLWLMPVVRFRSYERGYRNVANASSSTGLPTTNSHNARSAKLNFHIPHAGVLQ
jgi:hypothetical protein